MTKEAMVESISTKCELSKKKAEEVYEILLGGIVESLKSGEGISLRNFGTFSVVDRAARQGVNPRTGEPLTIPAHKAVKFAPGKELKEAAEAMGQGFGLKWLSKREFFSGVDEQLGELKKHLNTFKEKSGKFSEDAKHAYRENVDKLGDLYEETRYKYKLLKSGGSGAWDELKRGFEKAFSDLKDSFRKAKDKF